MSDNISLRLLIDRAKNTPVAAARLASTLLARGDIAQAADLLNHAAETAPHDGEVLLRRAEMLSRDLPFPPFFADDDQFYFAYAAAFRADLRPGSLVLCLGGSNGVLAIMAARAGAGVVLCQPNAAVADAIADIVARNGLAERVHIVAKHSGDLEMGVDLERPADAIIWGDLVEGLIFGDDLSAVADAVRRLTQPGAKLFPLRAMTYAGLAEDLEGNRWQLGEVAGFDLSQFNALAQPRLAKPAPDRFVVSGRAEPLVCFDPAAASEGIRQADAVLSSDRARVDGVLSWIVPEFAGRMSPTEPRRTGMVFHRFPRSLDVAPDTSISIRASHDGGVFRIWPRDARASLRSKDATDPREIAEHALVAMKSGDVSRAFDLSESARAAAPDDAEVALLAAEAMSRNVDAWYFNMAVDTVRLGLYEETFRRHIRPDHLVLEIGTGTGLFAMMAARAGAKVVTCERNPTVAHAVRRIVERNGFADRITVLAKSSLDLRVGADLARAADVVVWDNLASNLIGAGVLPAVEHALRRLAKPGARVIPQQGRVFAALAQHLSPADWLKEIPGLDVSPLWERFPSRLLMTPRMGRCAPRSPAAELFAFDFQSGGPFPGAQTRVAMSVDEPGGVVEGVVQWVRLDLDETTIDENWPPDPARKGLVSLFHRFAMPRTARGGETISVKASHDRDMLRIWTDLVP